VNPTPGRKPKVQIALRPALAKCFRAIAKLERRELSDVFKELLAAWMDSDPRARKKYAALVPDEEEDV